MLPSYFPPSHIMRYTMKLKITVLATEVEEIKLADDGDMHFEDYLHRKLADFIVGIHEHEFMPYEFSLEFDDESRVFFQERIDENNKAREKDGLTPLGKGPKRKA